MRTRIINVLGTSSGAGKSFVSMNLCKVLSDMAYRVAPFKAVNISLNSVALDGGYEIPRAQWLQCLACGIEPSRDVSPFLIKPEPGGMSQLIVRGKSYGTMTWDDIREFLSDRGKEIVDMSLRNLSRKFRVIVAEGSGSPSEINMGGEDLSNSYMTGKPGSASLLVGNIDPGGVFGALLGNALLMKNPTYLRWVVINMMRGNSESLRPGIERLEKLIQARVIGVVPFMEDLRLPGEDLLDYRSEVCGSRIAVVRYPYMENYSDLDPVLLSGPGVCYATHRNPLPISNSDLIILPGSKNVFMDLKYLRLYALDKLIVEAAKSGKLVLGICGGYQMLSSRIKDPYHVQSPVDWFPGLGLLECEFAYSPDKIVRTVKYRLPSHKKRGYSTGYEIRYGQLTQNSETPFLETESGSEGSVNKNGNVFGTNIHSLLENREIFIKFVGTSPKNDHLSLIKDAISRSSDLFAGSVDFSGIISFIEEGKSSA